MEQKNIQLKELCRECLLYGKNIHQCPFCTIDFTNKQSITQAFKNIKHIQSTPRANVVCRQNKFNTEILHFAEEFSTVGNRSTAPRKRLFFYDSTLDVVRAINPDNEKSTITNLLKSRNKNHKRALNSFLDYGQNNEWQYFFTITFDPRKIDSTKQDKVKYAWKLFRQKLQYKFPDVKVMCVVEYHKDNNKLHFHGVIARANLNAVLCRAVNMQLYRKDKQGKVIMRNGQPLRNGLYLQPLQSNIGDKIYNFNPNFYTGGFCSVIPLTDRTNDLTVYEKVVFYLAKYMAKDKSAVPYNGKSFFGTRNLDKGNKECFYMTDDEFDELLTFENFTLKKNTARFSSYTTRTTRLEFVSKIRNSWHPMADGVTCADVLNELDTILPEPASALQEPYIDPIFLDE